MDWLQFFSSIIASLAWPSVVALLLILLRSQLASLAQRLEELTLPGGAKASFKELIQEAKTSAEFIASKKPSDNSQVSETKRLPTPKDKIFDTFQDAEAKMAAIISELPIHERKTPADFIFYTLKSHGDGANLYKLYENLRQIIFSSTQAPEDTVSNKDVEDFAFACDVVLRKFETEFAAWKAFRSDNEKSPRAEAPGH
ncbi:hypothetical protein [Methylobacterium sp. R2-1]|uniref:hypothetical protein n=1 Tax=Methylobacterium sp. R2-1 TaxID=2587064 RepID=UPI00160E1ED3|nr:hypothetical protein [Methylobacterium sp. R2-1]MBB2959824.1 hypothetical protein [Methylobacterium sp. R2-1]